MEILNNEKIQIWNIMHNNMYKTETMDKYKITKCG